MTKPSREDALLVYISTIASDSRVRAAGWSIQQLSSAVGACVLEDLREIAARGAKGAAEVVVRLGVPAATDAMSMLFRDVGERLGEAIRGRNRSR